MPILLAFFTSALWASAPTPPLWSKSLTLAEFVVVPIGLERLAQKSENRVRPIVMSLRAGSGFTNESKEINFERAWSPARSLLVRSSLRLDRVLKNRLQARSYDDPPSLELKTKSGHPELWLEAPPTNDPREIRRWMDQTVAQLSARYPALREITALVGADLLLLDSVFKISEADPQMNERYLRLIDRNLADPDEALRVETLLQPDECPRQLRSARKLRPGPYQRAKITFGGD